MLDSDNELPTLLKYFDNTTENGFPTRTRSETENELNGNKVQFDENKVQFTRKHKFRSK